MSFESPLPPYNASDPTATFLNSSCLDLLLIELVPLAYRTVHALDAPSSSSTNPSQSPKLEEDEERDRVFFRLESLGYRVGLGLVERFSKDRPRFTDTLDVIKFLCKDLWMLVFRKQIDNLKTNHRVSFLLCASHYLDVFNVMMQLLIQRNRVYMFLQIIHSAHLRAWVQSPVEMQFYAHNLLVSSHYLYCRRFYMMVGLRWEFQFLYFPCGIIRGALASMGINATVQAESTELPGATFQIKSIVNTSTGKWWSRHNKMDTTDAGAIRPRS